MTLKALRLTVGELRAALHAVTTVTAGARDGWEDGESMELDAAEEKLQEALARREAMAVALRRRLDAGRRP